MNEAGDAGRATRCRFPARHDFLAARGLVPGERGECPELDAWRAQIGDVGLTLVFPEAFLGNPSSMFGHTLLRFDPKAEGTGGTSEALLGWTLDYTADPGHDPAPVYVARGLTGRYLGYFGIAPYYQKTRVYSDWQDRDIWEYPVAMAPADVERVLLHVWEMRGVGQPYLFFTKNCSEYLLEILAVAWPDLGRGGGFPPAVTPVDTLRAIADHAPGTLGEPSLRASPATRLQEALAGLGEDDARRVEALANGELESDALDPARPAAERARLVELAYTLLRHEVDARRTDAEAARARSTALLRARARLAVPPAPEPPLERLERAPPHGGHRTARVALAGGIESRDGFVELRGMPAYHTRLDDPTGFAEGGEIRFLETAVRYYPELQRVRLHEMALLDVTTASPWRAPFRPLAWHTELAARSRRVSRRERGEGLEPRSFFRLQGGAGAALAPRPRLHLYAFGEVALEAAPAIEGNAAIGPLLRAGASWSTRGGAYTVHAEGLAGGLLGRDPSEWLRAKLEQRVSLHRDWSLTLTGHFERAYDVGHFEGRLGLTRYF